MRFKGVSDDESLGNRLKGLRVGERRIFMKFALFRRSNARGRLKESDIVGLNELPPITAKKASATPLVRGDGTFDDIVEGVPKLPGKGDKSEKPKRIIAESVKVEELKWLQSCAVGSVKSVDFSRTSLFS